MFDYYVDERSKLESFVIELLKRPEFKLPTRLNDNFSEAELDAFDVQVQETIGAAIRIGHLAMTMIDDAVEDEEDEDGEEYDEDEEEDDDEEDEEED